MTSWGRTYELLDKALVNLDTTAPPADGITVYGKEDSAPSGVNLRSLLEGMTFGWFFDENIELTVQADAAVSGEAEISIICHQTGSAGR